MKKAHDADRTGFVLNLTKNKDLMAGESVSAFSFSNARALAKLGAAMANKGSFEGTQILSEQGWNNFHANPTWATEGGAMNTNFTQGGVNKFFLEDEGSSPLNWYEAGKRDGFYGWMGFGGSVFQWNPHHQIGFAYCNKNAHATDILNGRGSLLQQSVLNVVKN